jgi:hypothetical protein
MVNCTDQSISDDDDDDYYNYTHNGNDKRSGH